MSFFERVGGFIEAATHTHELNHRIETDLKVFNVLRKKSSQQLDKIEALPGDFTKKQLGFEADDSARMEEVSVVFHVAASVFFMETLKGAINHNLRPVMAMLDYCDALPKLEAFVYVSTAYSHSEHQWIDEKIYPPPMELDTLLDSVEHQHLDEAQTRKFISPKQNTYTFTKAMAEYEVGKRSCRGFPAAIFRPPIVTSSLKHPFPGWIDSPNGPSGVISRASTGVLRVFHARKSARADMAPVDLCIDTLIAIAWETAVDKAPKARVYNCSTQENPVTWGFFKDSVNDNVVKYPSERAILRPKFYIIKNRYLQRFLEAVFQTAPLYVIEYTKRALFMKSSINLIETSKRVQAFNKLVEYFGTHEWNFANENVKKLRSKLSANGKELFNLDPNSIQWDEFLKNFVKGNRRYVLREPDDTLDSARARVRKLGVLSTLAKGASIMALIKLISQ